jgi:diguanylate cyclase (GGDEF)-like protein
MAEANDTERGSIQHELNRSGLRLRFPAELERRFLTYYLQRSMTQMRTALVLGFIMYGLFGILDAWIIPDAREVAWVLRYAIVCPMIAALFLYSFFVRSDTRMQIGWTIVILAAGMGIVVMLAAAGSDTADRYYSGVILVIFYAYVFARLRTGYATLSAFCLTLSYLAISAWVKEASLPILINDIFFLVTTNVVGLPVCFLQEKFSRTDFLQKELLGIEKTQLELANRRLKELSMVDGLTGLGNRRQFEAYYKREWKRALREQYPLACLMIDVDHFKDYNDHYGHQAGDECLKRIAGVLETLTRRPGDLAARYGGEEFVVILVGTGTEDAARMAEHIRQAVQKLGIAHETTTPRVVTVSIGLTSMVPAVSADKDQLIGDADDALYEAKRAGRNRVCHAHAADSP